MKKTELDISEIRMIIRNLISFIVVDSRSYIADSKKSEYVESYVHLLVKIMNLIDEEKEDALVENIANDIAKHLQ